MSQPGIQLSERDVYARSCVRVLPMVWTSCQSERGSHPGVDHVATLGMRLPCFLVGDVHRHGFLFSSGGEVVSSSHTSGAG